MRRYGRWAGNAVGQAEDVARCIEDVLQRPPHLPIFYQCDRKRGHGPNGEYCKQHGKKAQERIDRNAEPLRIRSPRLPQV